MVYRKPTETERGQTSIDLLLAVTIFFIGMGIIIATYPGMLSANTISPTEEPSAASSLSQTLKTDTLSKAGGHGLAPEKVKSFFQNPSHPNETITVPQKYNIQITITHTGTGTPPPTLNDSTIKDGTTADGNVYATRGPSPSPLEFEESSWTTLEGKEVKITTTLWIR